MTTREYLTLGIEKGIGARVGVGVGLSYGFYASEGYVSGVSEGYFDSRIPDEIGGYFSVAVSAPTESGWPSSFGYGFRSYTGLTISTEDPATIGGLGLEAGLMVPTAWGLSVGAYTNLPLGTERWVPNITVVLGKGFDIGYQITATYAIAVNSEGIVVRGPDVEATLVSSDSFAASISNIWPGLVGLFSESATEELRRELSEDSDHGYLMNSMRTGDYWRNDIPKSPEVQRAVAAANENARVERAHETVSYGNEPVLDKGQFGIPGPGPAYGYNSTKVGASGSSASNLGKAVDTVVGWPRDAASLGYKAVDALYGAANDFGAWYSGWVDAHVGVGAASTQTTSGYAVSQVSKTLVNAGPAYLTAAKGYSDSDHTSWAGTDGASHYGTVREYNRALGRGEVKSHDLSRDSNGNKHDDTWGNKPGSTGRPGNRDPILLDLDNNGVRIGEFGTSTQIIAGKDGLQHRTAWAAAGDGVLFFDPDGRNAITEMRQYVFTEWNPTAAGDLEALRSVWDSNGDGKLFPLPVSGSCHITVTDAHYRWWIG